MSEVKGVFQISLRNAPGFRFEWHPRVQKLYLVRIGAVPELGEPIESDVISQDMAAKLAQMWFKGYRERDMEATHELALKRRLVS